MFSFGKKYLPDYIYSLMLFIRTFKKFKREVTKEKSDIKFSKKLDRINDFEFKITSQNNEDGIINYIFSKILTINILLKLVLVIMSVIL